MTGRGRTVMISECPIWWSCHWVFAHAGCPGNVAGLSSYLMDVLRNPACVSESGADELTIAGEFASLPGSSFSSFVAAFAETVEARTGWRWKGHGSVRFDILEHV